MRLNEFIAALVEMRDSHPGKDLDVTMSHVDLDGCETILSVAHDHFQYTDCEDIVVYVKGAEAYDKVENPDMDETFEINGVTVQQFEPDSSCREATITLDAEKLLPMMPNQEPEASGDCKSDFYWSFCLPGNEEVHCAIWNYKNGPAYGESLESITEFSAYFNNDEAWELLKGIFGENVKKGL